MNALYLLSNAVTAKRDKKYDAFLKSVLNPSILIIDELGYFNMTKEESNHFFQIISKRYEKGSTIITSNLEPLANSITHKQLAF